MVTGRRATATKCKGQLDVGVHGISDDEKRARGTFKAGFDSETRKNKKAEKILAFPTLHEVPPPTFPLGEKGQKTYDTWARRLLEAECLNEVTKGFLENLALTEDKIHARIKEGKEIPDKTMEIRRSMLLKLESLNVDTSRIPKKADNKFTHNGFPARIGLRQNNA